MKHTIRDMVEIACNRGTGNESTDWMRTHVGELLVKSIGNVPVQKIKPDDIERWIDDLRARNGTGHTTIETYKRTARAMLNMMVKTDRLDKSPMRSFTVKAPAASRWQPIPREPLLPLIHDDSDAARYVCFCRFAGLRISEVYRLRWEDIVELDGMVVIQVWRETDHDTTKQRDRLVPVCDDLMPLVRPGGRGAVVSLRPKSAPRSIRSLCKRYGIDTSGWNKITHDLRKSRAKELLDAGVPEDTVAKVQGDTVEVLRKHYDQVCATRLRAVLEVDKNRTVSQELTGATADGVVQ